MTPQGDKSAYTQKQKRQARHIEEGYEKRGVGRKEAEKRAWATVNKTWGGGLRGKKATLPVSAHLRPREHSGLGQRYAASPPVDSITVYFCVLTVV